MGPEANHSSLKMRPRRVYVPQVLEPPHLRSKPDVAVGTPKHEWSRPAASEKQQFVEGQHAQLADRTAIEART